MSAIPDDELRRHLDVNRQPLISLAEDEVCWRLGPVEVRKHEPAFRVGFGHPVLPSTHFALQAFDLDGKCGSAVVLVSGGRPPHYFAGWVPIGREQEAMRWVDTLNQTLRHVSGGVAATTSVDLDNVQAIVYEVGHENAPDSPFGLQALTASTNGHIEYKRKRAGVSELRAGSVASTRVAAVVEALRRTTFPVPPQTRFVPGGSIARIELLPSAEQVQVDYFEALRMDGYSEVVRELSNLCKALRTADAQALAGWQFVEER